MAEYIDKSEIYRRYFNGGCGVVRMHVSDIDVIPTADVSPVVHAGWIHTNGNLYCCSACCGYPSYTPEDCRTSKFCPHCGAKMDLPKKEED